MLTAVEIHASRITLRACLDLDWTVTSYCARCGMGRQMDLAKVCESALAAEPIERLLRTGAIRCRDPRTKCAGEPAHYLTVSWMNVGTNRDLARWRVETISGRRVATFERPRAD